MNLALLTGPFRKVRILMKQAIAHMKQWFIGLANDEYGYEGGRD